MHPRLENLSPHSGGFPGAGPLPGGPEGTSPRSRGWQGSVAMMGLRREWQAEQGTAALSAVVRLLGPLCQGTEVASPSVATPHASASSP